VHYAIYAPTFNDFGSPERLLELAEQAEAAGYDAFFIWDHLILSPGRPFAILDATVMLGALARATRRMRLGAMVTPLARRRPWKFAKEMVTLDHLSDGRVICGVGLGEPAELEFGAFGEARRERAARLDEGLALFDGLVRGEQVTHRGTHYALECVQLAPAARQTPRMPVWVAACLPARAGVERAVRWDGLFPVRLPSPVCLSVRPSALEWRDWWLRPDEMAALRDAVMELRGSVDEFALVASGRVCELASDAARARVRSYAEAGANWWCEWVDEAPGSFARTLERIRRGPPR